MNLLHKLLYNKTGTSIPDIPPFSAERDSLQYVVAIDGQGRCIRSMVHQGTPACLPGAAVWPPDAPVTPMTDHKGRRYECTIPSSKPSDDDTSSAKVCAAELISSLSVILRPGAP